MRRAGDAIEGFIASVQLRTPKNLCVWVRAQRPWGQRPHSALPCTLLMQFPIVCNVTQYAVCTYLRGCIIPYNPSEINIKDHL